MERLNVNLSMDTVGGLCEGGFLEDMIRETLSKIVNEEDGADIESQVYLARQLVTLDDLYSAIDSARARERAKRLKGEQ